MPTVRRAVPLVIALWSAVPALCVAASAGAQPLPVDAAFPPGRVGPGAEPLARYDGEMVVRTQLRDARDIRVMLSLSADTWTCRGVGVGEVDFRIAAEALDAIEAAGIPYEVLIPDLQAVVEAERAQIARVRAALRGIDDDAYHDTFHPLDSIRARMEWLIAQHPGLATRVSVGESLEGRELFAMRISGAGDPATKPAIVFNSNQHAREWLAVAATMYAVERMLADYGTDPVVTAMLDAFTVHIVPVVNPDGYVHTWQTERMWRKNMRRTSAGQLHGVDPNRNWDANWGSDLGSNPNQNHETYRGPAPFSEPETAGLAAYINALPRVVWHFDIHTYGQWLLEQPMLDRLDLQPTKWFQEDASRAMARAMFNATGARYTAGASAKTLYPVSGGMADWTYREHGAHAWVVELRDRGSYGFIAPAAAIRPTGEELYAGIRAGVGHLMERRLAFSSPYEWPWEVRAAGEGEATRVLVEVADGMEPFALTVPGEGSGAVRMAYRHGRSGAFTVVEGVRVESWPTDHWAFDLPGGACHAVVQYYFTAPTAEGNVASFPAWGALAPFEAVSRQTVTVLDENFDGGVPGWTAANSQTVGWTIEQLGGVYVPDRDRSPGGTGPEAPAAQRILLAGSRSARISSGGAVARYTSPAIDLSTFERARLTFNLHHMEHAALVNASGVPRFRVEVSADGGQTWGMARAFTDPAEALGGWRNVAIDLHDAEALTGSVRVRFAYGNSTTSPITCAAIDDVRVVASSCPTPACAGDFDGDGAVTTRDITEFLTEWFARRSVGAGGFVDVNGDGRVDSADITGFLSDWFAGRASCGR